jgi:hypothetical protein
MLTYINQRPDSPLHSVEFATVEGIHYCFFRLAPHGNRAEVEALLQHAGIHQTIVTETKADGEPLLVTQGHATPEQILQALNTQGNSFAAAAAEAKKFNPWAWRGITSVIGQSLQIASSFTGVGAKADRSAIFGFASLNLIANFINIKFGGQKKDDKRQLRLLKEQFNQQLAPYVAPGTALPDPDDNRLKAYAASEPGQTFGQQTSGFVQKYSVSAGEIGLRTVGSLSLAFPLNQMKNAVSAMKESGTLGERLGNAVSVARNSNVKTFRVGLAMLTGKFISFLAKEPDPYNPKLPSLIDHLREKVMFRLSSVVEGGAASYMAYDRFKNQKIKLGGKEYTDHFGGWGNMVFVGGYGVRYTAPYGTLEVNMPELYSHITDGLAKLPPEHIAPVMAKTAFDLSQHFKDKKLDIATAYSEMAGMLKKHHGITLPSAPAMAAPAIAASAPAIVTPAPAPTPQPSTMAHSIVHHERLDPLAHSAAPALFA